MISNRFCVIVALIKRSIMKIFLGSLIKIYDIETLANCFLYMDIDSKTDISDLNNIDSSQINVFVIHYSRNDLKVLVQYLKRLKGQIGFNNLSFDSQVCQFILNNAERWIIGDYHADEITKEIFAFAQEQINKQGVGFPTFNERNLYCKQLDLFKMHHFDNKAKVQSLKGLQVNLNWFLVAEMPIDFRKLINAEELQIVIDYCKNDIFSTKHFFDHKDSKKAIDLRKGLIKSYNLDATAINWSDSKIGSELILKFYCEHTNKNPKEVRTLRTNRTTIELKDCIPGYVKFKSSEFNVLLDKFKSTTLYDHNSFKFGSAVESENAKKPKNKRKEDISVEYRGLVIGFGIGGAHGSLSGDFKSDSNYIIKEVDVASLYPSLGIVNRYYPNQLGSEFVDIYRDKIVAVRLAEKAKGKQGNAAIVLGLKNAANSVYGKSNDKFSFLYDSAYTISTTISGQASLAMLVESIGEISDCKLISANTDSVTVIIHRDNLDIFEKTCKTWEQHTGLSLEETTYTRAFIRDVNSYIALKDMNGRVCSKCNNYFIDCDECKAIKHKGCFEKDKLLHKDTSARIVPLAIEKYVIHNVPIEETINNHSVIWDFLLRKKFKKNSNGEYYSMKNGKEVIEKAQKVARYYVANNTGKVFGKSYSSGKKSIIEKKWKCCDANEIKSENAFDYDVNRRYYIERAYKIIDTVENNRVQLSLF